MDQQDHQAALDDAADLESDGRHDQALALCDDILRRDPRQSAAWKIRTKALIGLRRLDDALASAGEAASLFPASITHRLMQARIHVLNRDMATAAALYRGILADHPRNLNAIRELMDLVPLTPGDDILRHLAAAGEDASLKPFDRATTWFLRAQAHMNANDDDQAFALFDEGNRQMRALHGPDRLEYVFNRYLPELDVAFQHRHAPAATGDPCPLLLVVGLPRSGKSLMEKLLATQPGLLAVGETTFLYDLFLELGRSGGPDSSIRLLRALPHAPIRTHFAARIRSGPDRSATRCIDTTPGNLEQLGLLGPLHPDVPIIFVRREPRDLVASLYFKQFNTAHRYSYGIETAARAVARTEYLARRWQETMPNPMVEICYDALVSDPVSVAASALRQIGMPVDEAALRRAAGEEGAEIALSPGRSLDGIGAIRPDLVGFSARFARQLAPCLPAYEAEAARLR